MLNTLTLKQLGNRLSRYNLGIFEQLQYDCPRGLLVDVLQAKHVLCTGIVAINMKVLPTTSSMIAIACFSSFYFNLCLLRH